MLGKTTIRRARYHCDNCGEVLYPLDEKLGLSRSKASKRLAKACTQLSIFMPFEHGRKALQELAGINLSITFLEQVVTRVGNTLHRDAEEKARRPYAIEKKERAVDILYVQADGALVPLVGEKGREYKENKLGMVFNNKDIVKKMTKSGKESVHIERKKFVSSLAEGVDPFKKMLFAAAVEKGYHAAKQVIFLGDGAIWLSKCKDEYFPNAIQILDWYHAVEHLWNTAHDLFGEHNETQCLEWVTPLRELLWEGKVDQVISFLEKAALEKKTKSTSLFQLRGYYFSNRDNMKYDEYRRNGWYIGSGAIESANKYVITQRLKLCGIRWNKLVADGMIWARCKYFENEWDQFWDTVVLSEYLNPIPSDCERAA